ncbi:MAG: ABC transporter ATP-binding protein/permease [Candidatus Heimdallarchaeota archaeon]|nr:ABC transporter ATP-binding protein/permease [Candidatus Heimdallarchaeota archaeon]
MESSKIEFKEGELWQNIYQLLKLDSKRLYILIAIMVFNVAVSIVGPLSFKKALDQIEVTTDLKPFEYEIILYSSIYSFTIFIIFFIRLIQNIMIAKINTNLFHQLRIQAYDKVMQNKISFFDNVESGKIVSRLVNDSNELLDTGRRFADFFSQIIILIVLLGVMISFNPILTLGSIVIAPFTIIILLTMRDYQRSRSKNWQKNIAVVNSRFGEIMKSIAISKSFGREEENANQFNIINEQTYKASKERGRAIFIVGPIQDFLKHISILTLIIFSYYQLKVGIAMIYLFILLQAYFWGPISEISRNYSQFQSSLAALERILSIMSNESNREDHSGVVDGSNIEGNIRFNNVSFSYNETTEVLSNISFNLGVGETLALVGHTGAGKSTIVSLLIRFYDVNYGEILIDNTNINDFYLPSLRSSIGYVAQNTFIFKGTIRQNLKVARLDASDEEIWNAIDVVQAREFIENLPGNLNYEIQEEGTNISQGQRQMISLARVILADPRIIILDEFTSSLDLYTEAKIQNAISVVLKNRTSIVIAHRLTTIINADKILVLANGRIIEEGTHHQLITKNGIYSDIFNKYFEFQLKGLTPRVKI